MGGIVGQADQYEIFEDRPRARRVAREAPQEVIREYTRGRSVGAGQLNPRNIRRQHFAGWHDTGYDPRVDGYAGEGDYPSPSDLHGGPDHFSPDEFEEEGYSEPPLDDYHGDPGFPEHGPPGRPHPFGTPTYNPRSSPYDDYPGSRLGFSRRRLADDAAAAAAPAPVAAPMFTHMFMPGSRVGLPYQDRVIPGIVHQLHPDSQVGVRWADGQYTTESPGDIQSL